MDLIWFLFSVVSRQYHRQTIVGPYCPELLLGLLSSLLNLQTDQTCQPGCQVAENEHSWVKGPRWCDSPTAAAQYSTDSSEKTMVIGLSSSVLRKDFTAPNCNKMRCVAFATLCAKLSCCCYCSCGGLLKSEWR